MYAAWCCVVLQALLVDPAHHSLLLQLVTAWPHNCFHPTALIDAIAQRMLRCGLSGLKLLLTCVVLLAAGDDYADHC